LDFLIEAIAPHHIIAAYFFGIDADGVIARWDKAGLHQDILVAAVAAIDLHRLNVASG
jgi:hypothetical protein